MAALRKTVKYGWRSLLILGQQTPSTIDHMDVQSATEVSFYRDANVVVTQSRFVTDAKTYTMRNISSVHVFEVVASKKLPVIIGSIGLVVCLGSESRIFGAIMLVTGIALFFAIKNSFAVRISTNSGEANSIISKDRAYIQKIVNALNEAIIYRG